MEGWEHPRHLKGRLFSVIVHGDIEGAENVRRSVSGWLKSMDLIPAGTQAGIGRYIGYWEPCATNHIAYEKDERFQGEVKNAARTLYEAALAMREGRRVAAGSDLEPARKK